MPIKITTPSAAIPVTQAQALGHLRVDVSEWDLVSVYLAAATAYVEDYTGRATTIKGYTLFLDRWPQRSSFFGIGASAGLYYGYGMMAGGDIYDPKHFPNLLAMELRRTPLVAITSVKYFPVEGGGAVTLDPALYRADLAATPGRLVFLGGVSNLPAVDKRADAVMIEFTAGAGADAAAVLATDPIMVMGILFLLTNWYENRVPIQDRGMPLPYGLQNILRNRRVDSMTPELS